MMSENSVIPLGELVRVKGGKRLPKGSSLQTEKNLHPYIRVRDMGDRYIPDDGLEYVPSEVFPKIQRYIVEENDVIISIVGTIGLVSLIDEKFNLASQTENCAKLSGLDQIDAKYLYYFLSSNNGQQQIKEATVGAVQPKLPLYNIEKIEVIWPERTVRETIVQNLSSIDDKIDLNRQTNQTLEHIAQAIFKSWFVNFDPTRAKIAAKESGEDPELAAVAAISGKSLEEIEQMSSDQLEELRTTAALFPGALVESELGEVPEGWEVKSLSELIQVIGGGTPKRSEDTYWRGDIPWYSIRDLPSSSDIFTIDTTEKITELGLKKSSTKLLPIGTTIISARGTVGKLALVGVEMCMNQSCYGILGIEGIQPYFNYFNLNEAVETLKKNTHGAVFDTITTKTFETCRLAFSGVELTHKFDEIVNPLLDRIKLNVNENRSLEELRDSLLPKLLFGEVVYAN